MEHTPTVFNAVLKLVGVWALTGLSWLPIVAPIVTIVAGVSATIFSWMQINKLRKEAKHGRY
jgi:membrane protein YqaA with SNARE-associated domain